MQTSQSSSSEEIPGSVMDQRKRKRMLSNRESARRSRMRKQQHLDELINQVAHLKNENSQIETQADMLNQQFLIVDSENCALRSEVMELTERLRSMNSVLEFVGEFSGMMMDIQEIPDPLLKPWQLPCPTQPLMFQY
ncbi:Basic-leucine zipper domain-containing protein [Dioscorea alata]|uniref:Basic-leucine zipper domain-containing protein n=1 Tax=Dioscorea alata TaxID=55571 RepID=A0ACB7U4B7_DIOAL|nr:Basic-leucine zipper domain-containing protein [Dioscorea alata]